MTITFPPEWKDLENPAKRAELLAFSREVSSAFEGTAPTYNQFDIDEVVHFFYDDNDFWPDTDNQIGYTLFDQREADSLRHLLSALSQQITKLGNKSTVEYLSDSGWRNIRKSADTLLHLLIQRGNPSYD